MGTGKGLLDSLIAEGGVKSRDWGFKLGGVVIEIRRARSDRNAAEFYSLIAEGEVKSRDLSWEAWLLKLGGLGVIEMQLNFMASYPYFTFYLEEIFCTHKDTFNLC